MDTKEKLGQTPPVRRRTPPQIPTAGRPPRNRTAPVKEEKEAAEKAKTTEGMSTDEILKADPAKLNDTAKQTVVQHKIFDVVSRMFDWVRGKKSDDLIDNNAKSHLKSFLLSSSETIPISNGKLDLGTWQSVFFIELDGPRKDRTVNLTFIND